LGSSEILFFLIYENLRNLWIAITLEIRRQAGAQPRRSTLLTLSK
jgi:hypothetical protein